MSKKIKSILTLISIVGGCFINFWLWGMLAMSPQEMISKTAVWIHTPAVMFAVVLVWVIVIVLCIAIWSYDSIGQFIKRIFLSGYRWRHGIVIAALFFYCIALLIHMQSIRNDLDLYVMPRCLTVDQSNAIREFLTQHDVRKLSIKVDPNDEEAREYWAQLLNAIGNAKWIIEPINSSGEPYANVGLGISEVGRNAKPEKDDGRELLEQALSQANVPVNSSGTVMAGDYKLFLIVGKRPLRLDPQKSVLNSFDVWLWLAIPILGCFCISWGARMGSIRRDFDNYVKPRKITDEQADAIREFLSNHKTNQLTVKVNPNDQEATEYSAQLLNAITSAKWTVEFITSEKEPYAGPGIHISEYGQLSKPSGNEEDDGVYLLKQALREANIELNGGGAVMAGAYKLYLLVGQRPLNLNPAGTWRFRLAQWLSG